MRNASISGVGFGCFEEMPRSRFRMATAQRASTDLRLRPYLHRDRRQGGAKGQKFSRSLIAACTALSMAPGPPKVNTRSCESATEPRYLPVTALSLPGWVSSSGPSAFAM